MSHRCRASSIYRCSVIFISGLLTTASSTVFISCRIFTNCNGDLVSLGSRIRHSVKTRTLFSTSSAWVKTMWIMSLFSQPSSKYAPYLIPSKVHLWIRLLIWRHALEVARLARSVKYGWTLGQKFLVYDSYQSREFLDVRRDSRQLLLLIQDDISVGGNL